MRGKRKNALTLVIEITIFLDKLTMMYGFQSSAFEGKVVYDKTYGHVTYGWAFCCGYSNVRQGLKSKKRDRSGAFAFFNQ